MIEKLTGKELVIKVLDDEDDPMNRQYMLFCNR